METTMGKRPRGAALAVDAPGRLPRDRPRCTCSRRGSGATGSAAAISLGIMLALGLVFLLGSRWDLIRQLRADTQDERGAAIDLRATAFAGVVVISAVIVGFMVDLARGGDGSPYT